MRKTLSAPGANSFWVAAGYRMVMELLVVGAGSMGRWFADSVAADVAFADAERATAEAAADAVGGRAVALDAAERFDAVCIAVPMSAATEAVADHADRAERAVVDVAGVMGPPVEAMREHAPDRERMSLHPLFAAENAPGTVAVVPDAAGPATDELLSDLRAAGNETFETTAAEHDESMETVQAKAHAAVLAYALAADEVDERFHTPLSGPLADLVEQVTGGNAQVYGEIQETFDGADEVAAAARRIADADESEFEDLYRDAS